MNYYDMLLQHQHRIADAEQRHKQDRHLRDLKRARQPEPAEAEDTEQPSRVARIVIELKATFIQRKRSLKAPATPELCPQPGIRVTL